MESPISKVLPNRISLERRTFRSVNRVLQAAVKMSLNRLHFHTHSSVPPEPSSFHLYIYPVP